MEQVYTKKTALQQGRAKQAVIIPSHDGSVFFSVLIRHIPYMTKADYVVQDGIWGCELPCLAARIEALARMCSACRATPGQNPIFSLRIVFCCKHGLLAIFMPCRSQRVASVGYRI